MGLARRRSRRLGRRRTLGGIDSTSIALLGCLLAAVERGGGGWGVSALLSCWEGYNLSYSICCRSSPRGANYNTGCWVGDDEELYNYYRCCDQRFGPEVRLLPYLDSQLLNLHYARFNPNASQQFDKVEINMRQAFSHLSETRGDGWWRVLWEDRTARALLGSSVAYGHHVLHSRRPLALLDLASGLGINVVAALKSGYVGTAVGLDKSSDAVAFAATNAALNQVQGATFLALDVCTPIAEIKEHLLRTVGIVEFDVFTMSMFTPLRPVRECAYELILALSGDHFTYFDSDTALILETPALRHRRLHFESFADYALKKPDVSVTFSDVVQVQELLRTDEIVLPVTAIAFTKPEQ